MGSFQRLYDFSNSEKLTDRFIFWGVLVFINAFLGFFLGFGHDTLGKVLGIITWLFLYVFVLGKGYIKYKNICFKRYLLSAYLMKTFFAIIIIGVYLDMFVGLFSLGISNSLFSIFGIREYYVGYGNMSFEENFLYTYITTLIHGGILSIITLLFGYFLYLSGRFSVFLLNLFSNKKDKSI